MDFMKFAADTARAQFAQPDFNTESNLHADTVAERFDLAKEVPSATEARMADHLKSCELAKQLKKEGIVVATTCVARHWGTSWYAWNDRTWPDGPQGHGKTEVEAIENLVEQLAEAMDRAGS